MKKSTKPRKLKAEFIPEPPKFPSIPPREDRPKYSWEEISEYPERDTIGMYAEMGIKSLPGDVQLAIIAKCDRNHPSYDPLFAEVTLAQAKLHVEAT